MVPALETEACVPLTDPRLPPICWVGVSLRAFSGGQQAASVAGGCEDGDGLVFVVVAGTRKNIEIDEPSSRCSRSGLRRACVCSVVVSLRTKYCCCGKLEDQHR